MKNTINIADPTLGYKLARINLAVSFEEESCYWNILQQASQVRTCIYSSIKFCVSVKVIVNSKNKSWFSTFSLCTHVSRKRISHIRTKIQLYHLNLTIVPNRSQLCVHSIIKGTTNCLSDTVLNVKKIS